MIDREVQIFNRVYNAVAPLCANKRFVSTIITEAPTAFPAASLIEMDNRTVQNRQTSTPIENYSLVTYQLDVYATTKSKCREVYAAADDAMIAMNFNRIGGQYINNYGNTKVFRYVARYEAMIDREGNIYRVS
jgi:hypothetical protein